MNNNFLTTVSIVFVVAILAAFSVHYTEELLMPVVERVRLTLFGDQIYTSAKQGCEAIHSNESWIHPTTLSLTVYGDAQQILSNQFGAHSPEVLPAYRVKQKGIGELVCIADHLLANSVVESNGAERVRAFRFEIPDARYNLKSGWVSGLAQSLVGQVFLAAYIASKNEKYLAAAREVGNLLKVPIDAGGVRVDFSDGGIWYEEYAQTGSKPPLVLNGHLLSLDFLHWMRRVSSDDEWEDLFSAGMRATVATIDEFVGFTWSFYDRQLNLANRKYHSFHIRQLQRYEIYDQSGKLTNAKETMQRQLLLPFGVFQRLLTQPSRLLLFLTGVFFAAYIFIIYLGYFVLFTRKNKNASDNAATGSDYTNF